MRIAFDISYVQKRRAGIGRHALQLVKSLVHADVENTYVLHGWSFGLDVASLESLRSPRVQLSTARVPGSLKRLYWNRFSLPRIESIVGDIQIFHSTDPFIPPVRKARRIATVHDLAYRKFPELFERRVLSWDNHVARSVRSADAIIVPSQNTRDDLLEMFSLDEGRISVIPPPVDACFTTTVEDEDQVVKNKYHLPETYILFAGTIEPRKNIIRLVQAFERIHRHHPVDLVLAGGKGWLYEATLRVLRESEARKRMHRVGYVTDRELASLYRHAACFVYPSLYEGFGFPVLEAMASGTPVITSNTSSMKELSGDAAVLVNPNNVDELAQALEYLLTDDAQRRALRERGLTVVRRFEPGAAARSVRDMYRTLA